VAGRLDPSSSSRWIASQIAYPYGLITIAPRTGEFSARPARRTTSPYQAGKSLDWLSKAVALSRVEQHRVVTHYLRPARLQARQTREKCFICSVLVMGRAGFEPATLGLKVPLD